MFKQFLVAALFLSTVVNASPNLYIRKLNDLQRRQSGNNTVPLSDFPKACQPGCAPAVNAINTCQNAACLCVATVDSSLNTCLNCVVGAEPGQANVTQSVQQIADLYNQQCTGSGVSSISITGGSGGGTATGTATGTDTGSSSPTATTDTSSPTTTSTPTTTSAPAPATTTTTAPTSTTTTKSNGATATGANIGYLPFTIVVSLLAALMAL